MAVSGFKTLHLGIIVWGSGPFCFSCQTQSSQEPPTTATEDITAVAGIVVHASTSHQEAERQVGLPGTKSLARAAKWLSR